MIKEKYKKHSCNRWCWLCWFNVSTRTFKKNYIVTIIDLMIYGNNHFKKNKNLKIVKGDIRNKKLLQKITKNQDA